MRRSTMKNRKGWSALNSTGFRSTEIARAAITAPVAAAASVPFSSTLTNALWKTAERWSRSWELGGLAMPVKSARAVSNASGIPIALSVSPRASASGSSWNLGRETATRVCTRASSQVSSISGESRASTAPIPSAWSGRSSTIASSPPR